MRESLTILAIAVILVLSALLVGPYFINWNNQRDFLASKLSNAVGARVTISGPIAVQLLPTPIFRVGQVSIAGAYPQAPRVTVDTFDAELSINGLLQGSVDFVDATVLSPRLDVTVRNDGSIVGPTLDVANPQAFQFKHVDVRRGSVVVHDEKGAERFTIGGLDAQGEADSLIGPLKATGTIARPDRRIGFRLNTGAFGSHRLRMKLVLDGGGEPVSRADLDGALIFEAPSGGSHALPTFEGMVNFGGALRVADGAAPAPWQVAATGIKTDRQSLTATAIELRAGADARALVATGAGHLNWGDEPAADLQLHARQLDLDRLAVAPEIAPDTPAPRATQWIALLRSWIDGTQGAGLPLAVSLDLGIDAITTGDLTFTDAAATLAARTRAPLVGKVAIGGPDGSRFAFDGTFEAGTAAGFTGRAEVATRNLAGSLGWLASLWPEGAAWIGPDPAVRALDFEGGLTVSKVGVAARDMNLTVDGSTLTGAFSLTGGVGGERPRLFADLRANRLDLAHLPDVSKLAAAAVPLDLSVGLSADAARVSGADRPAIESGSLALHLSKTGDTVSLDQLSVTGLGGANVVATATLDPERRMRTEGRIDAKDAAPLAGLLRQVAPGAVSEMLAAHAAALSPLSLAFNAEGTLDADGGVTPTIAGCQGTIGTVRTSASITPEPAQKFGEPLLNTVIVLDAGDVATVLRQWGIASSTAPLGAGHAEVVARGTLKAGFDADASLSVADATATFNGNVGLATGSGHLTAKGPNAAALLRSAALPVSVNFAVNPWDLGGDLQWQDGHVAVGKFAAHLNGSTLAGALDVRTRPATPEAASAPAVTGALTIDTASLASLTGLALTPPAQPGRRPNDVWSTAKFGTVATLPRSDIGLKIGSLTLLSGITAREAALTLRTAPGSVTLANLSGRLLDGTGAATITLRRDGPSASLAGQVSLAGLAFALPSLAGRLTTTLDLAATGTSPDTLLGSLAGDGSIAIAGARMPRLDPDGLNRVAKVFDLDSATVDDDAAREALAAALDRGALAVGDIAVPASVAAGTLRATGVHTKTEAFTAVSEGALDLRGLALMVRTTVSTTQEPKDWKGDLPQVTVTWTGPLTAPNRTVDAAAFVNGLAARAIARDQERIELMQSDIRERAFFARRLKQIEAEQQAARDAALIQKMAPPAAKAGDPRPAARPSPAVPPAPPAPTRAPAGTRGGAASDDLTRFLNTLGPGQPAPQKGQPPGSRPIPPAGMPNQTAPNPSAAAQDPTSAGR